jgi:hypothetical protein
MDHECLPAPETVRAEEAPQGQPSPNQLSDAAKEAIKEILKKDAPPPNPNAAKDAAKEIFEGLRKAAEKKTEEKRIDIEETKRRQEHGKEMNTAGRNQQKKRRRFGI